MEQVLPLEEVPYDAEAVAKGDLSQMTAEQYLSWVRHQADELPPVTRSSIELKDEQLHPKSYMPYIEDIPSCTVELLPSEKWMHDTLFEFSELRSVLYEASLDEESKIRNVVVPQLKDEEGWYLFCLASEYDTEQESISVQQHVNNHEAIEVQAEAAVSASVESNHCIDTIGSNITAVDSSPRIEQLDNKDTDSLLKRKRDVAYQMGIILSRQEDSDWDDAMSDSDSVDQAELDQSFNSNMEAALEAQRWSGSRDVEPKKSLLLQFDQALVQRILGYHISWLQDRKLTTRRSQWLYGLLARLEKPLHRETASQIRQCYRRCCILRSNINIDFEDQLSNETSSELAALNVLIAICGSYFGQSEEHDGFVDEKENGSNEDEVGSCEMDDEESDGEGAGWDELDGIQIEDANEEDEMCAEDENVFGGIGEVPHCWTARPGVVSDELEEGEEHEEKSKKIRFK